MTHICVGNLTIIGSDNGLSPGRRQAITWTNVGKLLIGPLGTNFCEILIEIHTFSFKKIHLKMSSGKCRPFCLGLNVLNISFAVIMILIIHTGHSFAHVMAALGCHDMCEIVAWLDNYFSSESNMNFVFQLWAHEPFIPKLFQEAIWVLTIRYHKISLISK